MLFSLCMCPPVYLFVHLFVWPSPILLLHCLTIVTQLFNEHLVDVAFDLLATSSVIVSAVSSNLSHHFFFQNALLVHMRSQELNPGLKLQSNQLLKDSTLYRYL